ncbi:MAG: putative hydroxymethylpyrimidine transporter CytX [Oscillospiraceae bacterium]|nr:putative hydroxymethylpyrimidine transporter CytX [Oscillospiraceae bacterium]
MQKSKTSVFSNALIWFGAAVSIAEILTGTALAPLGFAKGIAAIVIGHIIGGVLMYLAGIIGAQSEKSSMETVKMTFGKSGSHIFSALNVLQLVGWTAVMISSGASAATSVVPFFENRGWVFVIGALIALWIIIGIKNLKWLNIISMAALFALSIVLSVLVFSGEGAPTSSEAMSFGAAVECSAAMPISWLPLISDYTRHAEKKRAAALASVVSYGAVSCWMFIIGMGAASLTGEGDIAKIMVAAKLGVAALAIIILSTVTTTFLDAYSAGISAVSIVPKLNEKWAAITTCVLGTILALFSPENWLESFLYLIGSVFVPMITVQLVDYFIFKNDSSSRGFDKTNLILWLVGLVIYRLILRVDIPVGVTLPAALIIATICIIIKKILGGTKNA